MSSSTRPTILILNAALGGDTGNTAYLLRRARAALGGRATVSWATLSDNSGFQQIRPQLMECCGLLVGTGTHWDSWSHLLQKFLQDATPDEATDLWLGKPAGVIVTMHSVGGKGVLSRLQGVLNTLGCAIPPMSGLVYSEVGQTAVEVGGSAAEDIWTPDDTEVICHNLLAALEPKPVYRTWPVDRSDSLRRWIRED